MGKSDRVRRSAADTRELVLAVAADLFYAAGIRATGIDTVAARAGVAPPTLYRLFATKDDLVAAYVQRCSAAYIDQLTGLTAPDAGTARDRLRAVFALFTADARSKPCRGCPFQLVLAEYPDPASAPHVQAVAHKQWVQDLLSRLVAELADQKPFADADLLARQLAIVADGIYSAAQVAGANGPAKFGVECAESLIDAAVARRP